MDLNYSPEEQAFQLEVREFLRTEYPKDIQEKVAKGIALKKEDYLRWQKILYKKGWVAPGWPKQYGGTGWTPVQKYIFEEECGAANCLRLVAFGLVMLGPVLLEFGSEKHKQQYLPDILQSNVWWAQGYSEPNSGSDLASLQTKAIKQGDHYIVNGSKTWTTHGHYADKIFVLVRTSQEDRKQKGISFLLIDMDDPGVTVDPIITVDGMHVVNQVFFVDVKVPVENLVGKEGDGWTIAKYLLQHERTNIAQVPRSKAQIKRLKELATAQQSYGKPLLEDERFRSKIAEIEVELMALEMTSRRVLSKLSSGAPPGASSSLLKVKGTEVQQSITALLMEAVGYYGFPYVKEAMLEGWQDEEPIGPEEAAVLAPHYFDWRKTSIYGGSNEIQKNIMAKAVLGL
ncbi:MAG: pimeloyl-CoA dehydrogenase large subunit [Piscirickettsiaceae bacterium]|nr:MAG: pimeloyl-CoA dehydrogenase large subunit [Piscirickettsiaceae bacterium]PCI68832.1 MAG: pimeloyl-CoA dehydrogenase large subunit [Piscirickettsiaceae bacterium]